MSAARLYWESKGGFFDAKDISTPYAISVFPDELYQAPSSWAERAYPNNLIHYKRAARRLPIVAQVVEQGPPIINGH